MIKIYLQFKLLIIKICNIIKLLKFSLYLYKNHIFRDGNPQLVLRVIQKFIELESTNYPQNLKVGRSVQASTKLLITLIDEYFNSKSEVVLNQILEVLKTEFVKRNLKSGK